MQCYCNTIKILENDIKVISSTISKLKELKTTSCKITEDTLDATYTINSNIDVTNRYVLINKLKEINKDVGNDLFNIIKEYEDYKIKLAERYMNLKVSDTEYHENEKLTDASNTSE